MSSRINKDITIIIILFKTPINKIKNLKQYKNFNLSILDQGSLINNEKIIKKELNFDFKYYHSKKNLGVSKGINFLIKKTQTKYCMITEPDILINEKSIINLKKTILLNKDFILSGPRFLKKKMHKKFEISKKIDLSCVLFKTKTFKKINFYDEDLFFFWTDVDLIRRINELGLKMVISRNSFAKHFMSTSSYNSLQVKLSRERSFKYGEFVYDYKYGKLRFLKIIRQILQNMIKTIFNMIFLKKENVVKNIGYLFGIFDFLIFYFFKILK